MKGVTIKTVTGVPTIKFWTIEEKNYKLKSSVKIPKAKVYVKDTKLTLKGLSEHIIEVYKTNGDTVKQISVKKYDIDKTKVQNTSAEIQKHIKELIEKHHPDIDEKTREYKIATVKYRKRK